MNQSGAAQKDEITEVLNPNGQSPVVVVCEHASAFIPAEYRDLGLGPDVLKSHAAWDPGARAVAVHLAERLDAPLVAARTSRLVYDCNRPPEAQGAMPARSEIYDIPGNAALTEAQKADRVARFYAPFHARVAEVLAARPDPVLVTMHSFTPVFHGTPRTVEIGVLHDSDKRLADAMLDTAARHTRMVVRRNDPYGPEDGVTHTLLRHALPQNRRNVMIEVRNDLIADAAAQRAVAETLAGWLTEALACADAPSEESP